MSGTRVALIGLGAMGYGQGLNLKKAGFVVTGYDVDPAAAGRFVAAGGAAAASPAEAARGADLLISLVFDIRQAESVLFGPGGAVETMPGGGTVILHTTGSPDQARAIAARLAAAGHAMLDAPVTGGKAAADEGRLTVMVSGPDAAFAAAEPALNAMCSRIVRVGSEIGAASTVKMVGQLLCGINAVAVAEALVFAARAGADMRTTFDVVTHGAGNSVMFERLAPTMLKGDFDPRGVVAILVKDLGILMGMAQDMGLSLPLSAMALQQYQAAKGMGYDRADFGAVVKVYEALAGIRVADAPNADLGDDT